MKKSAPSTKRRWPAVAVPMGALICVAAIVWSKNFVAADKSSSSSRNPAATSASSAFSTAQTPALGVMEVAKAVMVTVELDFGPKIPTIAEAIQDIERRYAPDDGKGRTFAILDAYGGPTADGKLHISMHVSSEKPGLGTLVFKRTGEVLWQNKIVPSTNAPAFTGKDLTILLDDGTGKTVMVDGSKNPASILDAGIRNSPSLVRDIWADGAEREVTYIYSACGCPVKVMVKRVGERTMRTKDMPVMFPDDLAVVRVISQLMGW